MAGFLDRDALLKEFDEAGAAATAAPGAAQPMQMTVGLFQLVGRQLMLGLRHLAGNVQAAHDAHAEQLRALSARLDKSEQQRSALEKRLAAVERKTSDGKG